MGEEEATYWAEKISLRPRHDDMSTHSASASSQLSPTGRIPLEFPLLNHPLARQYCSQSPQLLNHPNHRVADYAAFHNLNYRVKSVVFQASFEQMRNIYAQFFHASRSDRDYDGRGAF